MEYSLDFSLKESFLSRSSGHLDDTERSSMSRRCVITSHAHDSRSVSRRRPARQWCYEMMLMRQLDGRVAAQTLVLLDRVSDLPPSKQALVLSHSTLGMRVMIGTILGTPGGTWHGRLLVCLFAVRLLGGVGVGVGGTRCRSPVKVRCR